MLITTLVEDLGQDPEAVRPDTRLGELEVDSLALLELLTILEDEHHLQMPDDVGAFSNDPTLAEVADYLQSVQGSAAPLADAVKDGAV
ncbi:phosphopantetheine-binding protein [Streptomyces sp. NPDC048436]|uniref:phosphopantetheine-binding protein n=1 Tax=Streptomyces sp. NPDC048436 TaxID=3365550 RepID=UPI00371D7ACE